MYKIGIEEKDVKKNKARNSFLRILELMIWAIFGAIIALMAVSGLPVINKGIIILAIIMLMFIVYALFSMIGENAETQVSSAGARAATSSAGSRVQSSRGSDAHSNAPMKSEARISRNNNLQQANPLDQKPMSAQKREMQKKESKQVKSLVLINEEGDSLLEWSLAGKTALIIGKSTDKEKVDIDLECSAYAQMISKQHAVLNYTNGGWYIDDIDSKNGTRVKKLYQNSIMDVKLVGTVEVECGDIIYIANTMLQLK